MQQAKTKAFVDMTIPKSKQELRSFLGLANFCRRFVPDFAQIAKPLTEMTRADNPEQLTINTEAKTTFESSKRCLSQPPVLRLPVSDKMFYVDTDASNYQIGCVLQQHDENGRLHPIGFWSRTLHMTESKYSTVEREALAVVWATRTLRPYLEGKLFTVRSDQASLSWLFSASSCESRRLARFRLRLADFDFQVVYNAARKNWLADAMSRCQTLAPDVSQSIDDEIPCLVVRELPRRPGPTLRINEWNAITVDEMRNAQIQDPYCIEHINRLTAYDNFLFDDDGLLIHISADKNRQIVAPAVLQDHVLTLAHYPRFAGHPGGNRLYAPLKREYYWPAMARDEIFVERCPSCAKKRLSSQKKTNFLKLFPPSAPLEFI
jgi:RNase H-like domain found in reverse transcriptase/Integrase zinc binding domain